LPAPDRDAGMVTIRYELVDLARTLRLGVVVVAPQHQMRDEPDIDLRHRAEKLAVACLPEAWARGI
jgi:hypothetical protein